MSSKKIELKVTELSPEQKSFIDTQWNKLKFDDLVKRTLGDEYDSRSPESKLVTDYLGDREPTPSAYKRLEKFELNEDQKEFIRNNLAHYEYSSVKIGRALLQNPHLQGLNKECRVIYAYIQTLPPEMRGLTDDEICEEYKPINTVKQVVEKVNAYMHKEYDYEKLNTQQKKHFDSIKSFLKSPRFLQMINQYVSKQSREIFEAEFIRTVYDKPDLTPDELNLCINLCSNYVLMITIAKHLDMLNEKYVRMFDDPDQKGFQGFAEMVKAKTDELNKCDLRQQKLIDDLQGKRSERFKNKKDVNLTMAQLIEWWKDEKERKEALRTAEARKKTVEEEVDKLIEISDFKARIIGLTKSELCSG